MSQADDIQRARWLFKDFQKRGARAGEIIGIAAPPDPVIALEVGILLSLAYKAKVNGVHYMHDFEAERPRLYVSPGGTQAFIVGGSYRFTKNGFIK